MVAPRETITFAHVVDLLEESRLMTMMKLKLLELLFLIFALKIAGIVASFFVNPTGNFLSFLPAHVKKIN